eukprot:Amastigsp_a572_38.p6 type:complete len:126 gc:universal Amastigsp_a572_38:655-278(-)
MAILLVVRCGCRGVVDEQKIDRLLERILAILPLALLGTNSSEEAIGTEVRLHHDSRAQVRVCLLEQLLFLLGIARGLRSLEANEPERVQKFCLIVARLARPQRVVHRPNRVLKVLAREKVERLGL